jgi:hypothetical protein
MFKRRTRVGEFTSIYGKELGYERIAKTYPIISIRIIIEGHVDALSVSAVPAMNLRRAGMRSPFCTVSI